MEDKEVGIKTIVGGDFNARTGERGGEVRGGDEDREEPERKSKDKIINAEGKVLLERLEELGWEIWNGSVKGNEEGELTYTGGNGESVIDYVIGEVGLRDRIERLGVEDKVDSDHHPVVVWVKVGEKKAGKEGENKNEVRMERYKWTVEKGKEWRKEMQNVVVGEEKEVEEVWASMKERIDKIFGREKEKGVGKR